MKVYSKPYEGRQSFEELSNEIKGLIFHGALKPEDELPSEPEIARRFGVRQTIRETMHILEQSGFITTRQSVNDGPFISDTILTRLSGMVYLCNVESVRLSESWHSFLGARRTSIGFPSYECTALLA